MSIRSALGEKPKVKRAPSSKAKRKKIRLHKGPSGYYWFPAPKGWAWSTSDKELAKKAKKK